MQKRLTGKLACAILLLLVSSHLAYAQSELIDDNRATIFVDFDVQKLRKNPLFQGLDIDSMLSDCGIPSSAIESDTITRIVFSAHCKDFDTFENYLWQDDCPFSFYYHVFFDDPGAASELRDHLEEFPTIEFDGKTYHRMPAAFNIGNCVFHLDDSNLVFGTDDYVLPGNHDFLTGKLAQQFERLPEDCLLRAVFDCQSGKEFLEGMLDSTRRFFSPEIIMFLKPFLKLDTLGLAADFENSNVLKINAISPDEESAQKFHGDIPKMLNMGEIAVATLATSLTTDAQRETFDKLISQHKAERDGTAVSVDVNQPKGFVELVAALTADIRRKALRFAKMEKINQAALPFVGTNRLCSDIPS